MGKCPACGAEEYIGVPGEFRCGSRIFPISKQFEQNKLCRELCDLRKWREVVLKNVTVDWSEYDPKHWAIDIECDQGVSLLMEGSKKLAKAFDAAVRKEME